MSIKAMNFASVGFSASAFVYLQYKIIGRVHIRSFVWFYVELMMWLQCWGLLLGYVGFSIRRLHSFAYIWKIISKFIKGIFIFFFSSSTAEARVLSLCVFTQISYSTFFDELCYFAKKLKSEPVLLSSYCFCPHCLHHWGRTHRQWSDWWEVGSRRRLI
jgi:hypothetical protein